MPQCKINRITRPPEEQRRASGVLRRLGDWQVCLEQQHGDLVASVGFIPLSWVVAAASLWRAHLESGLTASFFFLKSKCYWSRSRDLAVCVHKWLHVCVHMWVFLFFHCKSQGFLSASSLSSSLSSSSTSSLSLVQLPAHQEQQSCFLSGSQLS